jgi:hypothetical protein
MGRRKAFIITTHLVDLGSAELSEQDKSRPHFIVPSHPNLVLIFVRFVIDHVEEPELIDALRRRNDAKPISELLFLEEFLGPNVLRY